MNYYTRLSSTFAVWWCQTGSNNVFFSKDKDKSEVRGDSKKRLQNAEEKYLFFLFYIDFYTRLMYLVDEF